MDLTLISIYQHTSTHTFTYIKCNKKLLKGERRVTITRLGGSSCRENRFNSHSSQPSVTIVPGNHTPSSNLHWYQTHTWCSHIFSGKTLIYIKKSKKRKPVLLSYHFVYPIYLAKSENNVENATCMFLS